MAGALHNLCHNQYGDHGRELEWTATFFLEITLPSLVIPFFGMLLTVYVQGRAFLWPESVGVQGHWQAYVEGLKRAGWLFGLSGNLSREIPALLLVRIPTFKYSNSVLYTNIILSRTSSSKPAKWNPITNPLILFLNFR